MVPVSPCRSLEDKGTDVYVSNSDREIAVEPAKDC